MGRLTEVLSDIGWSIKNTWTSFFDLSYLVLIHQDLVWNGLMNFPCGPHAQPNVSQNLGQAPGEGSIRVGDHWKKGMGTKVLEY